MRRSFATLALLAALVLAPTAALAEEASPAPSDAPVPTLFESPDCPPAEIGQDGISRAPADAPADCMYALGGSEGLPADGTGCATAPDGTVNCPVLYDDSGSNGPTDAGIAGDPCAPDENGQVSEMCQTVMPISAEMGDEHERSEERLLPGALLLAAATGLLGFVLGSRRGRKIAVSDK